MTSGNPYQYSTATDTGEKRLQRQPWLLRFLILGAGGLGLSLAGFVYGAVMVGVPYQDPTPEMARQEAFHLDVSGWITAIGGCVLLLSFIAMAAVFVLRFANRGQSAQVAE